MSLTGDETTEYKELWAKVIEGPGKRVGLAKKFDPKIWASKDEYATDKARLRELIGKKNES